LRARKVRRGAALHAGPPFLETGMTTSSTPRPHAAAAPDLPDLPADDDDDDDDATARIEERQDGFHWIDENGRQEFGPFETREAARADMLAPSSAPASALGFLEAQEQGLDLEDLPRHTDDDEPEPGA
jgi:hypothetical protein